MASGLQFDLDALLASAETVARVPIFLAALTCFAATSSRPSVQSWKAVPDEIRGDRVLLRPLAASDYDELRAIVATPEVAAWWGPQDDDFPEDEPESTRFTIVADGVIVGLIQYGEEPEPDFRHAWIDIFLDPAHHGRGLGTEAVATLLRHLLDDRGHHRVTIDPALGNKSAIRSYEKAGFEPVGVMRLSWRDPDGIWRDSLLMEHVRDPDPNQRK